MTLKRYGMILMTNMIKATLFMTSIIVKRMSQIPLEICLMKVLPFDDFLEDDNHNVELPCWTAHKENNPRSCGSYLLQGKDIQICKMQIRGCVDLTKKIIWRLMITMKFSYRTTWIIVKEKVHGIWNL